jgi:hypothetical protein
VFVLIILRDVLCCLLVAYRLEYHVIHHLLDHVLRVTS